MYNKKLKVLSLLALIAPLAACGGKNVGKSSDGGSASDESDTPSAPQPVEMTYEEAVAKLTAGKSNDAGINGYSKSSSTVDHSNKALYMSLKLTYEDGTEADVDEWDYWSASETRIDGYTNKVVNSSDKNYSGDGKTSPTLTDEFKTYDGSTQVRYVADDIIGVFEDGAGIGYDDDGDVYSYVKHGLQSAWGQAYCDWWDMTYGKYSASYIGQNTMAGYDEMYFDSSFAANDECVSILGYYGDDYYEDGVAPVTSVVADDESATLTFSISGDYGYTLGDLLWADSGYEGWVDAEVYEKISIEVKFATQTGVVTELKTVSEYSLKTNPNTGATLSNPYVVQTNTTVYSDFAKNGEYTGELKEVGSEFDLRFYDIFYLDANHYWCFTFSNGSPCPYQVDLTATKLNKAMTDGFSWSDPATFNNDGSITLRGAKAHTYIDSDGNSASMKYTYTFTLDKDGNLVSKHLDENGDTVVEKYYSSANWAAMNA